MTKVFLAILSLVFFLAIFGADAGAANPKVLMKTSKGDITIELYQDKAPKIGRAHV